MNAPRERKHRLPEAAYSGKRSVAFTVCEARRRRVLAQADVVEELVRILSAEAENQLCLVPVYCFMPDHLHLIVTGCDDRSRPKGVMDRFKQISGNWFFARRPEIEWQKDYYDKIVRKSTEWAAQIRYIALNPVRAGLVESVNDWPYTGSIGCDLKEIVGDAFW